MKHLSRITAAISAAAMMFSLAAVFPAHAADICQIDTSSTHQTIRGFGGINLPEWISQGDMTDAQRQKAFGNGADELGLTILRIYCSDDSNAWKNAVPTAKYAQKMGATIFATPWNPPASMRFNGNGTITGGKYQLDKSKSADYAKHLNSFVKYIESQGINLYSISVQNEPDYAAEWTYWSPEELTTFIANYGKAVTEGTKAKLMSPESFQYRKDIYNAILANPQASANIDLYGTHFYGTPREWMDFPALENSGKEIWMTEVYVPDSHADSADLWPDAIDVSKNIHNGVVVGNLNAYVWWYIRRSYGLLKENGEISKRGYCMAQYSKFVRPGDVRIDATESPEKDVYVSAYKNSKGQVTVVAVNDSNNGYAQQFSLAKGESITDVDRWRTSSSENIALTENLEYTGSSFWAQLPAKSVSTFVITTNGSTSTEQPEQPTEQETQPDANGYYFHDTFEGDVSDWTARGSAEVKLSGRTAYEGSESLLATERTSAWHGSAKPLDANTFKPGNAYSFSTNAMYFDGANTDTFYLKLQYKGSDGETHYASIAEGTTLKGEWVQLANENYTIPADASDMMLYVETPKTTNNFYIDDVIGAKAGTKIKGAESIPYTRGDVNSDGVVNIYDLLLAKKYLISGFPQTRSAVTADVSGNNTNDVSDIVVLTKFLHGSIRQFPEQQEVQEEAQTADTQKKTDFAYESALSYKGMPSEYKSDCAQQGTVEKLYYHSNVNNMDKTANVYLPYGYDPNKKYNIFYLMHGGSENENTIFSDDVKFNKILDNMIMNGDIEPMIVVTPTFNNAPGSDMTANASNFHKELVADLLPAVEGKYSTYSASASENDLKASRAHRAYGGFSMGGLTTWYAYLNDMDYFQYFMPLSGDCWAGSTADDKANITADALLKSGKKTYLFCATGTKDIAYDALSAQVEAMKKRTDAFTYTSDFSKGNLYFLTCQDATHWWGAVVNYIYDGLPYFFHES